MYVCILYYSYVYNEKMSHVGVKQIREKASKQAYEANAP